MNESYYTRATTGFSESCPFSKEQLSVLIDCVSRSITELKQDGVRSISQENGDIYTNLRRNLSYSKEFTREDVHSLLSGDKFSFQRNARWNTRQKYLVRLIEQIKGDMMTPGDGSNEDLLIQLRVRGSMIEDGTKKLQELNERADQLMGRLVELNKIIDPESEQDNVSAG